VKKLYDDMDQLSFRLQDDDLHPKRISLWVVVLCLLGVCLAISTAVLGGSLSRFASKEPAVIELLPPRGTEPVRDGSLALSKPEARPAAASQPAPVYTVGATNYTPTQPGEATFSGDLEVVDDVQAWNSETPVDLFRDSYNDTAKSENGEKIIAPGTSNLYGFKVKNNGEVPLDYTVSLEVNTYLGENGTYSAIPLEWRLLTGDGTAVSNWKGYNERTEVIRESTLKPLHQDAYTVEWRWAFDRGGNADEADTGMGNIAVNQPLGVNATIYIYAEQSAAQDGSSPDAPPDTPPDAPPGSTQGSGTQPGLWGIPQTGDSFNVILYVVLLAVSFFGLLILLAAGRKRRKDRENDRKES